MRLIRRPRRERKRSYRKGRKERKGGRTVFWVDAHARAEVLATRKVSRDRVAGH